jgi:threonine aldolase
VALSTAGKHRVRACTHLDVNAEQVDEAVAVIRQVVAEAA